MELRLRIGGGSAAVAATTLACLLPIGCSPGASLRDKIVGTWEYQGDKVFSVTTYHSDGTWVNDAEVKEPTGGESFILGLFAGPNITCSGTWKILDGRLVSTVTASATSWLKVGTISTDEILDVGDTALQLRPQLGDTQMWHRQKPPNPPTSRQCL
ncbi:MAG TPA: hypothetical protein VMV94_00520 [Phycisphaerae bacterium]|nr:hypothetical protein [Phycisphaerae bacterium]